MNMNRNQQSRGAPCYALLATLALAVVLPSMAVAADDPNDAAEQIARDARRAQEEARRQMAESERTQREALRSQEASIRRMEESQQRMAESSREMTRQQEEMARISSYPYPYPVPYIPTDAQLPAPMPPTQPGMPGASVPGPYIPGPSPAYSSLGGLELAPVSDRLGDYFGVTAGVLVVRTGPGSPYTLQDGDILLSIDGRTPTDAQHAARILRSYQPGERVKLRVQRDRRAIELDTTTPGGIR
jgi:hypothetical protein